MIVNKTNSDNEQLFIYLWVVIFWTFENAFSAVTGFGRGYIFWDDETSRNGNRHTQLLEALPDGTYDENTRMYFCCRSVDLNNIFFYLLEIRNENRV